AIVFIGSIPFGLPGIYLGVRLFATQYEVAIEGKSAFDALNGSWKLTKGHWWGIFGTFLLVGVALLVPLFVMNWMINLIVPQAGDLGILVATLLLFPPVMMIGLSVYGDLK
ncbi:MAG: glycerophosphoryl diester phosphodiesterase membrane domain-containing protein, partial [Cyanobacteria bacterium J06642_11]